MDYRLLFRLIITAHLAVVQSLLCVLTKRPDHSRGTTLRWSLPYAEICFCQGVVAPVSKSTCPRTDDDYADDKLWFVEDPRQLTMRHNWKTDIVEQLLNRAHCYVNECVSAPCSNGGTCYDYVNSYTCVCTNGWSGDNCDVDINECESQPCRNGGTCNDLVNSYTCTCKGGWRGDDCDVDINECASQPCWNGGACINLVNKYTCDCGLLPWTGYNCELPLPFIG